MRLANPDLVVLQVVVEMMDPLDRQENPVRSVPRDIPAKMENPVIGVTLDHQDHKDPSGLPEHRDHVDQEDCQENKELLAPLVT